MNHEEKKEKINTDRSFYAASGAAYRASDSKCSEVQSHYYSLRDRVRQMLFEGTSTVRIVREIKNDKFCTGAQKKRILSELHLKGKEN